MAVYEKTGSIVAGTNISGWAAGGAASAMVGVGLRMMVGPRPPDDGYHLAHDHYDVACGAIVFGIGMAAIYTMFRAYLDPKDVV